MPLNLKEIKNIVFNESVFINSAKGYSLDMLRPFAEFFKCHCSAVTVMGEHTFDSRYIHYNYPSSFLVHATNNFFYKEEILRMFKERIDESSVVCTWSTSVINREDFRNSDIYKERYEPNGLKHGMQSTLASEDGFMCGAIGCIRKIDKTFTEKDERECNKITPHIFYAYMKYRWLSSFDFYNNDDLESGPCALLQCDGEGRVSEFNSFAADIFKINGLKLERKMLLPEVFMGEIKRLKDISSNNIVDKFFYRNFEARFEMFRFVSFRTKKSGYKKLFKKQDGYLFVLSVEKVSMEYFLKLTSKEKVVLEFLSYGLQDKEIAHKMGVSVKTVQNHMDKVFKKLNVANRTEAALFAKDIGLNRYKIPKSKF